MDNFSRGKSKKLILLIMKADKVKDKDAFIEKNFNKIENMLKKGAYPLMQVCSDLEKYYYNIGDPEMSGAKLDFSKEYSALTWAIEEKQTKLLNLLLNYVSPREVEYHGKLDYTNVSPYELAIKSNNVDTIKLLEKYGHNLSSIDFNLGGAKKSASGEYYVDTNSRNIVSASVPAIFVAAVYEAKEVAKHIYQNLEKYNFNTIEEELGQEIIKYNEKLNLEEIKDRMQEYETEFKKVHVKTKSLKSEPKTVNLNNDSELVVN